MRVPRKFDREEGLLSLDFLIGFTIFLIALIFVGVMISGLLVHLQSRTIDYDAVAYRTSVVLVEDPGEPANWQLANLSYPAERANVKRLGLAIQKNYPGILLQDKVEKFFNDTTSAGCLAEGKFCNPEDYREKLIFGDYPYYFNISLKNLDAPSPTLTVGNPIPDQTRYGYIKRVVKIQKPDSIHLYNVTPDSASSLKTASFRFDIAELYDIPPPYRIDPLNQNVSILIRDFSQNGTGAWPNITDIQICTYPIALTGGGCIGADAYEDSPRMIVTIDGNKEYDSGDPSTNMVTDNVSINLEKGFFTRIGYDRFGTIDLIMTFDQNVTNQEVYSYDSDSAASLPELQSAVLEVWVW
jgi:hypothetical protein